MSVSHPSSYENLNVQCDGVRMEILWEVIRSGTLVNGICALIKETPEYCLPLSFFLSFFFNKNEVSSYYPDWSGPSGFK